MLHVYLVKRGMRITNFTCHRQFLLKYLEVNNLSLREFVADTSNVTSVSALSHFFKKNGRGEFVGSYCFGTDTWLEILNCIKLSKVEFDHLLLLKIQDDVKMKFSSGSSQMNAIRRIISRVKKENETSGAGKNLSKKAATVAKIYDVLPVTLQKELLSETERLSEYFLIGQKRSSRVAGLTNFLDELKV